MNEETRMFVEDLFARNELNRLPESYGGGRIFATPSIGVARGDDPIFLRFKEVVGPEHLTPSEMWRESGLPGEEDLASRLRIVSVVFPYGDRIREESRNTTDMPAEIYCVGRNFANAFMVDVLKQTVGFFQDRGFQAMAGMINPAFQIVVKEDPTRIYSVWSERHMAFAAGLGTFSLHEGLITGVGCNVRVTSVITDAQLEVTSRQSDEPYANCLHYSKGTCGKCMERCPTDAITEEGHDKLKCYEYGRVVAKEMTSRLQPILKSHRRRVNGVDNTSYPVGCAFCQFGVPCTDRIPAA